MTSLSVFNCIYYVTGKCLLGAGSFSLAVSGDVVRRLIQSRLSLPTPACLRPESSFRLRLIESHPNTSFTSLSLSASSDITTSHRNPSLGNRPIALLPYANMRHSTLQFSGKKGRVLY